MTTTLLPLFPKLAVGLQTALNRVLGTNLTVHRLAPRPAPTPTAEIFRPAEIFRRNLVRREGWRGLFAPAALPQLPRAALDVTNELIERLVRGVVSGRLP